MYMMTDDLHCKFEANSNGFIQKRILRETFKAEFKGECSILQVGNQYSEVNEIPQFVAIDGEFDQNEKRNVLSKITLVDQEGKILLDTLVNAGVPIDYSCKRIHGIDKEWLHDAPKVEDVRKYIIEKYGNSIFIGHGIIADLKVLALG